METEELDRRNIEIVRQIREYLEPLAERLTPEVEPALVFLPRRSDPEESEE